MIGNTISHYRIIEKLEVEGMGEGCRAHDITLDRQVTIKMLPEDAKSIADEAAARVLGP